MFKKTRILIGLIAMAGRFILSSIEAWSFSCLRIPGKGDTVWWMDQDNKKRKVKVIQIFSEEEVQILLPNQEIVTTPLRRIICFSSKQY